MIRRIILAGVFVLALGFFFVTPILAHGGEPRLEISPDRLNPGGVVDVRGVGFEPEEMITLSLTGPSVEISLSVLEADVEGIFIQSIILPGDLPAGTYYLRAITDDHEVLSPPLDVSGQPIQSEEGEALRDEEEPLLAPMPTYAPGVVPGDVPQATAQPAPLEAPVSNRNSTLYVAIFLAIGVLAVFGLRVAKKK